MPLIIRSSAIHAAGCYTTTPIRKGERVVEYTGDIVTNEEGDLLYDDKEYTYLFALDGGTHMVDGYGMAMYLNHSCEPNCETDQVDGKIWITAMRNIAAGEELTYDYNLFDGEGEAPCACGAPRCRGTMYSWDEIRRRKKEARKQAAREAKAAQKKTRKERAVARKQRSTIQETTKNSSVVENLGTPAVARRNGRRRAA